MQSLAQAEAFNRAEPCPSLTLTALSWGFLVLGLFARVHFTCVCVHADRAHAQPCTFYCPSCPCPLHPSSTLIVPMLNSVQPCTFYCPSCPCPPRPCSTLVVPMFNPVHFTCVCVCMQIVPMLDPVHITYVCVCACRSCPCSTLTV